MPKKNYVELLDEIEKILTLNHLDDGFNRLKLEMNGASTGGEYLAIAASGLLYLKEENREIKRLIGKKIEDIASICESTGLYPIPRKF